MDQSLLVGLPSVEVARFETWIFGRIELLFCVPAFPELVAESDRPHPFLSLIRFRRVCPNPWLAVALGLGSTLTAAVDESLLFLDILVQWLLAVENERVGKPHVVDNSFVNSLVDVLLIN